MNTREDNRITIVVRNEAHASVDWTHASLDRTLFADSVAVSKFALLDVDLDVERIIIDGAGSADAFLDLLAILPPHFNGDVVLIGADERGFLSAMGRGGDRVIYALGAADIQFYLVTHDLLSGRPPLRLTA